MVVRAINYINTSNAIEEVLGVIALIIWLIICVTTLDNVPLFTIYAVLISSTLLPAMVQSSLFSLFPNAHRSLHDDMHRWGRIMVLVKDRRVHLRIVYIIVLAGLPFFFWTPTLHLAYKIFEVIRWVVKWRKGRVHRS
jgi:hypothetical protein